MSYIGNPVTSQAFTPAIDYFNGNGSTVAFTLSRPVASAAQVQAVIENVPQNPNSAFTVSGNTITFTSAPPSGTANIYVYYTSPITSVATLSQAPSIIGPMSVSIGGATGIGGATNPIVNMSGASSNYVQAYVNNTTNGSSSSADIVAYANNSTDSHGWADMGFTSSAYADTTYTVTGPNEAYLFGSAPSGSGTTGNLVIATDNTGTSNSIQFYTNGFTQAKSAARMTIDGSGNVGIGRTPVYKFDVNGVANVNFSNAAVPGAYYLGDPSHFISASSTDDYITYATWTAGGHKFGHHNGSAFTERMRIDSSGNLLVGTTGGAVLGSEKISVVSSSFTLGMKTTGTTSSGYWVNSGSAGTSNAGTYLTFYCNSAATNTGSITTNGTITGYNTASDYRLKENIIPLTGALDKIAALKPSLYNYKSDTTTQIEGFIAHELQAVVPHAVTGEKDAVDADGKPVYQGVDASFLVPHLVAAIQEQQAIITSLTERITALENK